MEQQPPLPLRFRENPGFDIEEMRSRFRSMPTARVCSFLVRRRGGEESERRALAALGQEVAKRAHDGPDRRRLLWVLGELHRGLDQWAKAADAYHAAAPNRDQMENAFVLACARSRAVCLSRLGFDTEAATEYARFRRAATAYPRMVRARMERELAEEQDELCLLADAAESYKNAADHYDVAGYQPGVASCELEQGTDLMFIGRHREALRAMARARRLYASLGERRQVTRANELLAELFGYWHKPRRQLAAAQRAYWGLMEEGRDRAAAFAQAQSAHAWACLGRAEESDQAYARALRLLASLPVDGNQPLAQAMNAAVARMRLDYVCDLAAAGRFRESLQQASLAVDGLGSLEDVGRWRFARAFSAIGRAREALGQLPPATFHCSFESPPSEGSHLAPVGNTGLLLHLAYGVVSN